jgi:hypothetical protein
MIEACRRVASRPGGAANLYSGLAVSAMGSMPSVGLYFGVYSYCRRTIGPRLASRLGGERRRGGGLLSDAAIKNLSIACSAAIGELFVSVGGGVLAPRIAPSKTARDHPGGAMMCAIARAKIIISSHSHPPASRYHQGTPSRPSRAYPTRS